MPSSVSYPPAPSWSAVHTVTSPPHHESVCYAGARLVMPDRDAVTCHLGDGFDLVAAGLHHQGESKLLDAGERRDGEKLLPLGRIALVAIFDAP